MAVPPLVLYVEAKLLSFLGYYYTSFLLMILQVAGMFYMYQRLAPYVGPRKTSMPDPENRFKGANTISLHITWPLFEMERMYLAMASTTIFPIRLVWALSAFMGAWAVCRLAILGYDFSKEEPFPEWRHKIAEYIKPFSRHVCHGFGFHSFEIVGQRASRAEAPLVVANHQSFIDSLIFVAELAPAPVGALEQTSAPILCTIVRGLQILTVDRSSRESRQACMQKLIDYPKDLRRPQIIIFPEGTTSNGNGVLKFKPGAFMSGEAVQPVCVTYTTKHVHDPTWSYGPSQLFVYFRILCGVYHGVKLDYLPVHKPSAEEKAPYPTDDKDKAAKDRADKAYNL
jgi:lysophosphatidylcholine acyltransferase/lyso-PAF acetyltransferase